MTRTSSFKSETWPLSEPFRISRGVKTEAHVAVAHIEAEGLIGSGEAVPYARYGETMESVLEQMGSAQAAINEGCSREQLQTMLPAGAARNAIDCALWDLEAKTTGKSTLTLAGTAMPTPITTAITIGLDTIDAMAAKAENYKNCDLLKIKLNQNTILEKMQAIRSAAPNPRIIIDPNESWTIETLAEVHKALADLKVDMLEQPLPAGEDAALNGFSSAVPVCADESCHTRADLANLKGLYDIINIKLDKTGGLTEALALKAEAQNMGFGLMIGCMLGTSLAMAPALVLAYGVDFLDLDGPIWMKKDHDYGLDIQNGTIAPPSPLLWGNLGLQ